MNKAFVRENESEGDEGPAAVALPPGTRNYLTRTGYRRLHDELENLVRVERPNLVQVVAWAAGNGDRSENGDYIYGKKRLREIDRRIRFLMKRLDDAVVVEPSAQENVEQVFFGATVTVGDDEGIESTYQIVGIDEAEPGRGLISWLSPLARALMKARAGDRVKFQSPAGMRDIEVIEIRYR